MGKLIAVIIQQFLHGYGFYQPSFHEELSLREFACSSSAISTNANPFDLPVLSSNTRLQALILPNSSNIL